MTKLLATSVQVLQALRRAWKFNLASSKPFEVHVLRLYCAVKC